MTGAASGVIQGGWEFVIAAYAVSAVILVGYACSVYLALPGARPAATTPSSHPPLPPAGALLWGGKRRRLTVAALAWRRSLCSP